MKYDLEKLRDDLLGLVKDNLAAKISAINTEKADSITLEVPDLDAAMRSMNDRVVNEGLILHYGLVEVEPRTTSGIATSFDVTMFFMIAFEQDVNANIDHERKSLRYSRALYEVFLDNYKGIKRASALTVSPYAPVDWQPNADSPYWKVGGVEVTTTIAN